MHLWAGLAELAHCPHEHPGPEVRAADPDVDDVGYGPAVAAFESAAPHLVDETAHALASAAHRGHYVTALGECRVPGAQRPMEPGARPGSVDGVAREHARDPRGQLRLGGQTGEQPHRLRIDPVLGIVEHELAR